MVALISNNASNVMTRHLSTLRGYAKRVIVDGDTLSHKEELDRETRFKELAAIGDSLSLTEKDMVSLMFRGLLFNGPKCWCAECRSPEQNGV